MRVSYNNFTPHVFQIPNLQVKRKRKTRIERGKGRGKKKENERKIGTRVLVKQKTMTKIVTKINPRTLTETVRGISPRNLNILVVIPTIVLILVETKTNILLLVIKIKIPRETGGKKRKNLKEIGQIRRIVLQIVIVLLKMSLL